MSSNLLDLFPQGLSPEEPTTSSSSEDVSDDTSIEIPTSVPSSTALEYLAAILLTNSNRETTPSQSFTKSPAPTIPAKRKGRSLMETVDLLRKQKESSPANSVASESATSVVGPILSPPTTLAIPNMFVENESAADRLASMVTQEQEREVKNRIKALTNQISVDGAISPDDDKRFCCHICQKKFANKFLLNKHIFIHTGLRPHQCPDCHKSFNRKDNLLRHRKTHIPGHNSPSNIALPPLFMQAVHPVPHSESAPSIPATPEALLRSLFPTFQ